VSKLGWIDEQIVSRQPQSPHRRVKLKIDILCVVLVSRTLRNMSGFLWPGQHEDALCPEPDPIRLSGSGLRFPCLEVHINKLLYIVLID
jgi:hypothetical protein